MIGKWLGFRIVQKSVVADVGSKMLEIECFFDRNQHLLIDVFFI